MEELVRIPVMHCVTFLFDATPRRFLMWPWKRTVRPRASHKEEMLFLGDEGTHEFLFAQISASGLARVTGIAVGAYERPTNRLFELVCQPGITYSQKPPEHEDDGGLIPYLFARGSAVGIRCEPIDTKKFGVAVALHFIRLVPQIQMSSSSMSVG